MNFEFLDFILTPGEKHLGIARVKCWGKIVLRYKIVQKKEGTGYFPASASYKITDNGEDVYVSAFVLDSNSDREDLEKLIISKVKPYLSGGTPKEVSNSQNYSQDLPF